MMVALFGRCRAFPGRGARRFGRDRGVLGCGGLPVDAALQTERVHL